MVETVGTALEKGRHPESEEQTFCICDSFEKWVGEASDSSAMIQSSRVERSLGGTGRRATSPIPE